MIMNEATQEAMQAMKIRAQEQAGIKIDSCIFLFLGTPIGETVSAKTPVMTGSFYDIPAYLDNGSHDLLMVGHALEIAKNRALGSAGRKAE